MTTRLKAYIRRTVLASAREGAYPKKYRTMESTAAAFRDASHGIDSGWWSGLIYTSDVVATFNRFRRDVADAIREYLAETGADAGQPVRRGDDATYADLLYACSRRWTLDDCSDGKPGAENVSLALGLAIEYLTGEVASELGVQL